MVETILSSPLVIEMILPFLLIFAIVFAVLQKSKILGDGKKQVDSIVALAIGLIVVALGNSVNFILNLIPFLAMGLVVILVLMLFFGMFSKEGGFDEAFPTWLRNGLGIVVVIAVVLVVAQISGLLEWLLDYIFITGSGASVVGNVIIFIVVIAAVWVVYKSGDSGGSGDP